MRSFFDGLTAQQQQAALDYRGAENHGDMEFIRHLNPPQIIGRAEALQLGLKRYFTGKPCKHGHVCWRDVGGRTCGECHRLKTRRQHQELRKTDPDKLRENNRRRYSANREGRRAYDRKYREDNKDLIEQWRANRAEVYRKIMDLIAVLRAEEPELLKEFGL